MSSVYQSITSDRQIVSLLEKHYHWVTNVFSKTLRYHLSEKQVVDEFRKLGEDKNLTDKKVYDRFRSIVEQKNIHFTSNGKDTRSISRVRDINLCYKDKPTSYLDLGGGDGAIAAAISKNLNIDKDSAICADIDTWHDKYDTPYTKDITYVTLSEESNLPFENEQFSLVTCFQSLHHIKNLHSRLDDLSRIIKRGGYLIIREHDCSDDYMRMLIDIEHCIFELVLKDNQKFINEYYADYKSKFEWSDILRKLGFKFISVKYPLISGKYNSTRFYYAMYKKL